MLSSNTGMASNTKSPLARANTATSLKSGTECCGATDRDPPASTRHDDLADAERCSDGPEGMGEDHRPVTMMLGIQSERHYCCVGCGDRLVQRPATM